MQLLAERGFEHGVTPGLGWIAGDVQGHRARRPQPENPPYGLEHADRASAAAASLLEDIPTGEDGWNAYFVHSYHIVATDPALVVAETEYGGPVTAHCRPRQHCGHAVSSREKPEAWPQADRELSAVAALTGRNAVAGDEKLGTPSQNAAQQARHEECGALRWSTSAMDGAADGLQLAFQIDANRFPARRRRYRACHWGSDAAKGGRGCSGWPNSELTSHTFDSTF